MNRSPFPPTHSSAQQRLSTSGWRGHGVDPNHPHPPDEKQIPFDEENEFEPEEYEDNLNASDEQEGTGAGGQVDHP
jgi:hypothetical protein